MKIFFPLLAILMIGACTPVVESKGNENEPCLVNGSCNSDNLVCNSNNTCRACGSTDNVCCEGSQCLNESDICNTEGFCEPCGSLGYDCCPGEKCEINSICDAGNQCVSCGFTGEPCCQGTEGNCVIGACDKNNTCVEELCNEAGNCQPCGGYQQLCCEGGNCQSGFLCTEQSICEYCGELYTPPCKDNKCNAWYTPVQNECSDPFEKDPGSDISICQEAEPGYSFYTNRDWCFWSAAYHKNDTSLCDQISWVDMVEKCRQGEDPGDYYLTTKFE